MSKRFLQSYKESAMKTPHSPEPWSKGKLIGQKSPLKLKDIWAIRFHLQQGRCIRDLALFNLAIDSKLRGCDLVDLRLRDISHGNQIMSRAIVMQQKTKRPVQFEITEQTREAVTAWIAKANLNLEQYLFPSRLSKSPHITTRQYARIVHRWVESIGLDPADYGTHTMRRTKATLIYRTTKNPELSSYYLDIAGLKAQLDTWALRSMMHWRLLSRLKSSS
jgi:integrase